MILDKIREVTEYLRDFVVIPEIMGGILLCIIIFVLYRRLRSIKQGCYPIKGEKIRDFAGPNEWEEQMIDLAHGHKEVKWMKYNSIVSRYNQEAYKELNHMRASISQISSDIITLVPSARWLFDNFQMMYREIKKVKTTGTSYKTLPILRSREYYGYPRIYVIAKKMVDFSGGYLNEENISLMLNAYQKELTLTDKELWAFPEILGQSILERIIEVSKDIIEIVNIKSSAEQFVKERLVIKENYFDISTLLSKASKDLEDKISFHSHVIYLLKNMSVDEDEIQRYIRYHFESGAMYVNSSEIFKEEGKFESFLESSIRTLIVSLREINLIDQDKLFESLSLLEKILMNDPDGVYPEMDSVSRGMYRAIIEKFAQKHHLKEECVGEICVQLAYEGINDCNNSHHVGFYIIGKGYPILKAKSLNRPVPQKLVKKYRAKCILYIVLGLTFLLAAFYLFFSLSGLCPSVDLFPKVILFIVIAPILIGIALELTNAIVSRIVPTLKMPSMDYTVEVPDSARTFIVMPVIISTKEQGIDYINRLHKYYLANRQSNLYYALLADFADSDMKDMPEDHEIEVALTERINELNQTYPFQFKRFSLFIRSRIWNESEKCYMGWERKRGKIEEFNALLNGENKESTSFSTMIYDKELISTFHYVITLDADSNLIINNAVKMVGVIDHPLNRAFMDADNKKIKEGCAILQPSVKNHIPGKGSSRFPQIFGGQTGLANYSTVTSDIYNDVFDDASYVGKGIYNVQVFYQIMNKTIPENSVLSHDLLESCYVKTAFDSTVQLMDSFPGTVLSYAKREHRWIRGDWQLLPWLFKNKKLEKLSKWKIIENMRRSILPISKLLLIILNLVFIPKAYYLWLFPVLFSDVLNFVIVLSGALIHKIRRPKLKMVHKDLRKELFFMAERALLEIVLLPFKSYIAMDAICRTIYRLFVSKKNLLKWKTSEHVEKTIRNQKMSYFLNMWTSIIPATIVISLLMIQNLDIIGILLYSLLAISWVLSFLIAYEVSQPKKEVSYEMDTETKVILNETARRTWQFFKDFSTRENNWLCPDNYQMSYIEKVTNKTSPTNIGLQLLSILSAKDLGFETLSSTVEGVENLIHTVELLPKLKGHLFNWYNIKTMEVLDPQYISTVDSGNFLGDLIALKNGLMEQKGTPVISENLINELKFKIKLSQADAGLEEKYSTFESFLEELNNIKEVINGSEKKSWEYFDKMNDLKAAVYMIEKEIADFNFKTMDLSLDITLSELARLNNGYAVELTERIDCICKKIDIMLENADFRFLFDHKRMLFHIGYHAGSQTLDTGCYDLMASESSLTSLLAIAKGDVSVKHWYKLGRPLTVIKGIPAFVSWSGTMFEYLMPNLVMKNYEGTVFDETSKAAVMQQIKYAKHMKIPWGISESQYNGFDLDSNYQYRAFGVTGMKLQPSLTHSLVVSPYSTMLALEYAGDEALSNLKKMKNMGCFGKYGYYEAVDFNGPDPVNLLPYCIVKSFMAHHQGMSLVAINNFVNRGIMRKRFHTEPMVKAVEILLEEKRQNYFISISKKGYTINIGKVDSKEEDTFNMRCVMGVTPKIPAVSYLSNGNYSMMVTSDGDGFSKYKGMMLYRWRADLYANTGNYIYIKDVKKGKIWSTAYNPTKTEPDKYQAVFLPYQAEFKRSDGDITTHTEISLSLIHNLEIRKVKLTNHGKSEKQIELTSYLEVVGDRYMAEASHPAFNKLFIESEFIEENSIFLSRRRGKESGNPYVMHMVKSEIPPSRAIEYENDRLRFIGRNNTVQNPDAVLDSISLSNSTGFSSDPIMSLRVSITLGAEETTSITFITGVCDSREEAVKISDELSVAYRINDIFEKFRQQSEMELKYLNITKQQVNAFQDIISPLYYPSRYYRGPVENIIRNWKNQSFLWRFGVSGDNPIMLLRVSTVEEVGTIKNVLKAYEYLRINKVNVDLIILSEAKYGYMQELSDMLTDMISSLKIYDEDRNRPSLFILHSYEMNPAEVDLLFTVARVVFTNKSGIFFRNIKENQSQIVIR